MIKVLLVSADPKENHPLNLDQEFRRIEKVRKSSKYRDDFIIKSLLASTYKDFKEELIDWKPSFIHFCGHGMGEKGLVFVNDNGEKELINSLTLADLFRICQNENGNIACVTFNACHGEFQAKEIREYIKYSIGMSQEIKDNYAIDFAEAFYDAIFSKTTIETAFELGRNSIVKSLGINSNTFKIYADSQDRAKFDPAADDYIVVSKGIPDHKIPRLIINRILKSPYSVKQELIQKKEIISDKQWDKLGSILSTIEDFEIIKYVCRDTLKKDIQINIENIETIILSLKTLADLKKNLVTNYPKSNKIPVLYFANRLKIHKEISEYQKEKIQEWLKKIAKEKNIKLPILPKETESNVESSEKTLNSYLLISIIENPNVPDFFCTLHFKLCLQKPTLPLVSLIQLQNSYFKLFSNFTLEAELIPDYQEGYEEYKRIEITFKQEGINKITLDEIEFYISKLIYRAIEELPPNHNLNIELFVPFDYLEETFELCKIPSRRRKGFKYLGSQYQFTLRCLDRYEDKSLFNEHLKRWKRIQEFLDQDKGEEFLEEKCDYLKLVNQTHNWDKLYTKWRRNNYFSINIIDELPLDEKQEDYEKKENYFDAFLASGVPISLWSRKRRVLCDIDDNNTTIEDKFKQILNIESLNNLSEIFERIRQLREDAQNEGDKATDYLGYHLGFICDHPDLIPSNLVKRLTKNGLKGSN